MQTKGIYMPYRRSSIRSLLVTWSGNISGLLIPSSSPKRFHERNLRICKDIWYIFICVWGGGGYLVCGFKSTSLLWQRHLKYLIIECDTSIIQWFSHFPHVSYKEIGLCDLQLLKATIEVKIPIKFSTRFSFPSLD